MIGDPAPDRDELAGSDSAPASGVPSPCTSICRMDTDGVYCVGCFRTLEEIAGWSSFDDTRRRLIWEELRRRRVGAAGAGQTPEAACEPRR